MVHHSHLPLKILNCREARFMIIDEGQRGNGSMWTALALLHRGSLTLRSAEAHPTVPTAWGLTRIKVHLAVSYFCVPPPGLPSQTHYHIATCLFSVLLHDLKPLCRERERYSNQSKLLQFNFCQLVLCILIFPLAWEVFNMLTFSFLGLRGMMYVDARSIRYLHEYWTYSTQS